VEGGVKARVERRSQGCFVRAGTQLAWRDVVAGDRVDVLTRGFDYNLRPVCAGDMIEVMAALPPVAELESRRRRWLVSQAEREARALGEPGPSRARKRAAQDASAAEALDAIRQVAEGRGWAVGASAEGALEIESGGPAEAAVTARAEGRGACVELPVRFLAPAGAPACLRRAVHHAVLLLNARCAFARLRVVGSEPLVLRVEHQLPAERLLEDEIEHVLEGMRHAAREAAQTLDTIRHPLVSQEYVEAWGMAL
jgi:hypothetical protein